MLPRFYIMLSIYVLDIYHLSNFTCIIYTSITSICRLYFIICTIYKYTISMVMLLTIHVPVLKFHYCTKWFSVTFPLFYTQLSEEEESISYYILFLGISHPPATLLTFSSAKSAKQLIHNPFSTPLLAQSRPFMPPLQPSSSPPPPFTVATIIIPFCAHSCYVKPTTMRCC